MSDSHGDVGAYVAHALDHDERRAYEAHEADCPTCRLEAQEFDETLAELTLLSATPPPARLRGELLAAVRQVRPLPPTRTRPVAVLDRPAPSGQPAPTRDRRTPVTSLSEARRSRTARIVPLLASLVAAALVVALSLGVWVHTLDDQHRTEVAAASAETQLLSAPDARIYTATLGGQPVSYVVSHQRNQAMILGEGVPDPGVGRTYQLWRITAAGPVPAGLIEHGGTVRGWFEGPMSGVTTLAVTLEHSGGAQHPTPPIQSSVEL